MNIGAIRDDIMQIYFVIPIAKHSLYTHSSACADYMITNMILINQLSSYIKHLWYYLIQETLLEMIEDSGTNNSHYHMLQWLGDALRQVPHLLLFVIWTIYCRWHSLIGIISSHPRLTLSYISIMFFSHWMAWYPKRRTITINTSSHRWDCLALAPLSSEY